MYKNRLVIVTHISFNYLLLLIADNIATRDISLTLYPFLCHHIVGTDETKKIKRTFNTIRDNLSNNTNLIRITSGSFGEGLEMEGSDVDIIHVLSKFKANYIDVVNQI